MSERRTRTAIPQRVRREAHFQGHVQGVGFRYSTRRIAAGFQVTGFVRNLEDGRVQIVVEGADDEVQRFLDRVSLELGDYIRSTQVTEHSATQEFGVFDIRH